MVDDMGEEIGGRRLSGTIGMVGWVGVVLYQRVTISQMSLQKCTG